MAIFGILLLIETYIMFTLYIPEASTSPTPDLRINIIPLPVNNREGPPPYDEVTGGNNKETTKTVTPDSGVFVGRTPSYTPNGVLPSHDGLTPANDIVMDALPEHRESPVPGINLEGGLPGVHGDRSRRREPSGSRSQPSTSDSPAGKLVNQFAVDEFHKQKKLLMLVNK